MKKITLTDKIRHVVFDETHVIEHVSLLAEKKMAQRAASMATPLFIRDILVNVLVFVKEDTCFCKKRGWWYSNLLARIGGGDR